MTSRIAALALAAVLAACGAAPVAAPPAPAPIERPRPAPLPPPTPALLEADPGAAARIDADVRYLASPELAGRGTGEPGAELAARHVASRFAELGLAPLGDPRSAARGAARGGGGGGRDYRQRFEARVGAKVAPAGLRVEAKGKLSALAAAAIATADGSASGAVNGQAVFVGYGVSAPAAHWDDYAGADLSGKIAVVLDGAPPSAREALRDFGGVRYKLRTAREHKAAGVVIVAAGEALPPPPADASSMGVPGVVVKEAALKALWAVGGIDAAKARVAAEPAPPRPVAGGKLMLETRIDPVLAEAWNVVGALAPSPGVEAAEWVVVGAHYDHLGHGGTSASRAPGVRAVHPGADDNASGTALLLEVAHRLAAARSAAPPPRRGFLFVAFGGEEIGTLGSRWFVEHPPVPIASVTAMINADMVGRMRNGRLLVDGVGTSPAWPDLVRGAGEGLGLDIAVGAEGFGASDHASFTAARVPVAFLFTGVHDDYHLPSDTADKIAVPGIEKTALLAARLALEVSRRPERLAFVDAPADPHRGAGGGFKVSLGTIPDYAFQGRGVRLTGVRPDAPAARAGMQAGDVIVKVAAHEITNIHDYMFALGELEAGREVTVEVERGGKRIPLKVVPAPGR